MNTDLFAYNQPSACPSQMTDNQLYGDRQGTTCTSSTGQPQRGTNSCLTFPKDDLKLNQLNGFKSDVCKYRADDYMSIYPGNYQVSNFYDCNCVPEQSMNLMYKNQTIAFNNGYGWVGQQGCVVDYDSQARLGGKVNVRCKKQLYPRLTLSRPFQGRGIGDICNELQLQAGEDTGQKRQCNNLSDQYIDTFIPLVPCLKANVQNPIHLIEQSASSSWIRGGLPSRQFSTSPCCFPCNRN